MQAASADRPATTPDVIFSHSAGEVEDLAPRLAAEGYLVFVPNYRLAPKYPFPAARTDVIDAMNWALGSQYPFDRRHGGRNDGFLRWVILQDVAGDRSLLPEATTVRRASSSSGPVYMVNSLSEFVPAQDAMTMQRELAAAGVESSVHLLPGTAHAKGYLEKAIGGPLDFVARTPGAS
jgi:acetyl esterase/lipase